MIDTTTCNAHVTSGCKATPPTATVGNCPAAVAINHTTQTVYVANLCDGTVSVLNEATCNAHVTSGCSNAATVAVGNGPMAIDVNEKTDTVYVGNNGDGTVAVIDGATCNAQITSGCGQSPPTVQVPQPLSLAVDEGTNTVYVTEAGQDANGYFSQTSSMSMIDGARCNRSNHQGCSQAPDTVPVGGLPWGVTVDAMTHDVYVTSIVDSTLNVFEGNNCNGHNDSGCHLRPFPQFAGGWPTCIGLDPGAKTLYVANNVDGTVSLFSTRP